MPAPYVLVGEGRQRVIADRPSLCAVRALLRAVLRCAAVLSLTVPAVLHAGVVEERGIETLFKGNHQLCHLLSFVVRTANAFVGSLLWVDFVRLCGMQKAPEKKAVAA